MDKRGVGEGAIIGWVFLSFFVVVILCGFISNNLCDRLLIAVGIFGMICVFFGHSLSLTMHAGGFVLFLLLTFLTLVFWIVLKGAGVCVNLPNLLNIIPNLQA